MRSAWQIHGDGSAGLQLDVQAHGQTAVWLQNRLRQIPDKLQESVVSRWLSDGGLRGTGRVRFAPIIPFSIREEFSVRYADDFELLRIPESVTINSDALALRFEQSVQRNGNLVAGWRGAVARRSNTRSASRCWKKSGAACAAP